MPKTKQKETATDDDEKTGTETNGNGNGDEGKEETQTPTNTPKQAPHPQTPATNPNPRTDPAAVSEFDKGVAAERQRVQSLQALDRPATHEIIAEAIKDGKTAADVTAACIDAMDKAGKQNARRVDASSLNEIPGSDGGMSQDSNNEFRTSIKNAVASKMKQRRRPVLNSRS